MSNAVNGSYIEGRYNAVLNDDTSSATSLPPLVALQFLGFAFSEQGENSLRITNESLNRIREELEEVNDVIAIVARETGEHDDGWGGNNGLIPPHVPEFDFVESVLKKYDIEFQYDGDGEIVIPDDGTLADQLQTVVTTLSNDLQRLITQSQSEGSRVEQGNSFGESARQTSDSVTNSLLSSA